MKKVILTTAISLCLLSTFIGCVDSKSDVSNQNEKVESLKVNLPYSIRNSMSMVLTSEDIEKQYGTANLKRESDTKNYEIRDINDGSKLITIYDKSNNSVQDMWQLKTLLSSDNFNDISKEKSTADDIIKIDPYTNIIETGDNTAISEHRLANNTVINIDYIKKDGSWIVNNITPDTSNFTNILNDEDLNLIS